MLLMVYCAKSRSSLVLLGVLAWCAATFLQAADAQDIGGYRLRYGAYFSPATAASLQIQAEAQYLEAIGSLQKDLAQARERHAEARRLELANDKQALRDYFDRRELIEAERARKVAKRMDDIRESNKRHLDRLKNHPELTGAEVETGAALNFLMNRLSPSVVAFRSTSLGSQDAVRDVFAQMHLSKKILHALQVRQRLGRGESFVFRLDEGQPVQVDWWPPALRVAELKEFRTNFEKARAAAFETQMSEDYDNAIAKLIVQHTALEEAFLNRQNRSTRLKSPHAWIAYNDGKAFLQTLSGEIRRMEKLGPGRASPQSLVFDGTEMPELLAHMVRNGLEFAPAKPGDEPEYRQIFHMLRDLYVAFEFDDERNQTERGAKK